MNESSLYAKFLKVYANVPPAERVNTVVVYAGKPYSWDAVYIESLNKTELSISLLEQLNQLQIII